MTDPDYIDAVEGEDILLKCSYNTVTDTYFVVNWYKPTQTKNDKPDISNGAVKIWTYDNTLPAGSQDQAIGNSVTYIQRANPNIPVRSSHSITIKNVIQQEEAFYVCQLELNFGAKTGTAYTKVNVLRKSLFFAKLYFLCFTTNVWMFYFGF